MRERGRAETLRREASHFIRERGTVVNKSRHIKSSPLRRSCSEVRVGSGQSGEEQHVGGGVGVRGKLCECWSDRL